MNTKTTLILALIWALIFFGIGYYIAKPKPTEPTPELKHITTELINLNKKFSELPIDTSGQVVNANYITNYLTEASNPFVYMAFRDSSLLVIDSLKKVTVALSKAFLTLYPEAPKLVLGKFKLDTVELTLLNPSGKIETHSFGVEYRGYDYQYYNDRFTAQATKKPPNDSKLLNKRWESNLYASLGLLELTHSQLISLDYEFIYRKIKIQTSANLLVYPKTDFLFIGKVGYKLNK